MGCLAKCFKFGAVLAVLLAVVLGLLVNGQLSKWGVFSYWASRKRDVVGLGPAFMMESQQLWEYDAIPDGSLDGKVAVVTGANIGLGYYTSMHLARKGATVVMACRTMTKCDKSANEIRASLSSGKGSISTMYVDTSKLASVQAFDALLLATHTRLDILVLNAGIAFPANPEQLSEDGVELVFATNHLGHFKMYKDLRPLIEETSTKHGHATVVHVSSSAHYNVDPTVGVHTNLMDLNALTQGFAYGQSKLCNVIFAMDIASRAKASGHNILSNSLMPGAVDTNIWAQLRDLINAKVPSLLVNACLSMVETIRSEVMWTSEEGARTQVYLAADPSFVASGVSGLYFHPVVTQMQPLEIALDEAFRNKVWDFSEKLLADRGF